MADSQGSRTAKKNQKRKGKKAKDSNNELSYEEVLRILKEQLEMAKMEQDHKRANELRDQVWIVTDICRGKKTDIEEERYMKILNSLPLLSKTPASSSTAAESRDRDAEEEEENAKNVHLSEPEKQMKKLKKKLEQIEKLKAKQENGETLEKNQLDKLKAEQTLRGEIDDLQELIEATLELS